jgi:tetratricopeptide (TPR) repeat protein
LERYVRILDDHERAAYVFSPAIGLIDGQETGVLPWTVRGTQDVVRPGRELLTTLLRSCYIAAPSVMARKQCYRRLGLYATDLVHANDWYMWCLFALHYDVAYIAEPMVCYRLHDLNMTKSLRTQDPSILVNDDIAVRWRLIGQAKAAGAAQIVTYCQEEIIGDYVRRILGNGDVHSPFGITLEQFHESLRRFASDQGDEWNVRARVYAGLADHYYWRGNRVQAVQFYKRAVQQNWWSLDCWAKYLLIRMGEAGVQLRKSLSVVRRLLKTLSYASRPG